MTTLDERHEDGARDGEALRDGTAPGPRGHRAVPLDHPAATLTRFAGSKAAHLARAARAGLPVLPGFVVPYETPADPEGATGPLPLGSAWQELSHDGTRPLVVRSSSPQEDTQESSLAGQFASVLDVRGLGGFGEAIRTVLESAHRPDGSTAPMAVLVQPMLAARVGGVLFGADPVEGRTDRMLVSAVRGGPDSLVSGEQPGTNYWLNRRGRLLRTEPPEGTVPPEGAAPVAGPVPTAGPAPTAGAVPVPAEAASPVDSAVPVEGTMPPPGAVRSDGAASPQGPPPPGSAVPPHGPLTPESAVPPQGPPSPDSPMPPRHATPPAAPVPSDGPLLTSSELRRLARLARRAQRVFGGPQDIEFGFDGDGRLWLFQSRPITAMAARPPRRSRLLGPGPVAETLPGQLEPLEEDLWLAPMARGLAAALDIGGSAPRRQLRTLPVVTAVGGRAAADLRLLGAAPPVHRRLAFLNPAPGARRLAAAWRVGRLSAALPGLAVDLVADVDHRLAETPSPSSLASPALVSALRWARTALVSLHAQEALASALLPDGGTATAAGAALTALADARAEGVPEDRIAVVEPVVLALVAPSLRAELRLPGTADGTRRHDRTVKSAAGGTGSAPGTPLSGAPLSSGTPRSGPPLRHDRSSLASRSALPSLPPRESLRLRVRWVQELQVRLVREGARRLAVRGGLGDPARVGLLRWEEFTAALEGGRLPGDMEERLPRAVSAPLPDTFRLTEGGVVVAERRRTGDTDGRGVAGGRAAGTAWDGTGPRPPDAVLVVRTLDPALAPLLPGLTGLVAQTGSPLSHLAVLAREFALPTVVGASDAVRRFPPGSRLTVDGTTGDVGITRDGAVDDVRELR
ncbi:pyruvate phosphate dikinase [Streptomyces sp. Tue6028]|uniref:PEP/pyruvate-binding domain-containing protein n=1 Tax=Streptomyces sp. Tue6028 TaxID=2036037 RepID=UPI000BCD0FCE|nr:PEP/pyruvate-binding domain-containing protein [Streptomyces sp. Tue6028]PBC64339.1 pyruvate phosphate dikinase [Streptomyces sp. Tue6028]